jgi:hypothetical protein
MNFKNGRYLILGLLCATPGIYSITLGERVNDLVHRGKLVVCRIYDGVRYPGLEKRGINNEFADLRHYKDNLDKYFKHPGVNKELIVDTIKKYDDRLETIKINREGCRSLENNKKLTRRIKAAEDEIQTYKTKFENYMIEQK